MEVIDWIIGIAQILVLIGAFIIWNKASNHYRNEEYRQAIYHILYVILLVLIVQIGG